MWTVEDRERYKDDGRRYPSDLTDAEWELVRSLFETYPTLTRDIRAMVDGCLYLGAEGCRWRSLPKDFGPWQTVRGYWDRFRRDGVWADVAALLTPAARARLGKAPAPSTGIVDSQSVTSGPQKGERGVDGNKKVRGIKRHLLTCSFGFVLAVLVSAANLHDTHGLEPLLERAAEAGWDLRRVKVDAIYAGPAVRAAAERHAVDVQVSLRDPAARGFAPLPVRWRIEATFGTLTNRYRRLTRNLEQSGEAAENVVEPANLIPALRSGDGRGQPGKVGQRAEPPRLGEERVPGRAGGVHHGLVAAGEHAVAQPAVAQVLPHPLDRIEFGTVRGRVDEGQVRRHGQPLADVPAGPVQDERGVGPGRDRARQLGQEDLHGRGRDLGQHQRDALAALRAHGPEQVGRGEALLPHPARTRPSLVPDVREAALLPDPGLVHEPQLDPPGVGMPVRHTPDQVRQLFLKRSCAFGSASGWTGRAFCQERSSPLSSRLTPLSL